MKHSLDILPFNNDYGELAGLIQRTWHHEHSSYIEYTPEYLEFLIRFPDTERDLTLGAYVDGKLVSFLLAKKKEVIIRKKSYRTVFYTLATTDPAFAPHFPYIKLKDACVKRAIQRGFELSCGYAAWGIRNNEIEQLYADRKGFQCTRVHSFGTFVREPGTGKITDVSDSHDAVVTMRAFLPDDLPHCLGIVNESVSQSCTIFEKPEAAAYLKRLSPSPYTETTVVEQEGMVVGFVNYASLTLLYKNFARKTAIIYNFFLQCLPFEQKAYIITELCKYFAHKGIEGISLPNTGYFHAQELKKLGFLEIPFKSGRTNFYITAFHEQLELEYPGSFYLEII